VFLVVGLLVSECESLEIVEVSVDAYIYFFYLEESYY